MDKVERKLKVEVVGWGKFIYTETDIAIDRSRGFEVIIISEMFE